MVEKSAVLKEKQMAAKKVALTVALMASRKELMSEELSAARTEKKSASNLAVTMVVRMAERWAGKMDERKVAMMAEY